MWDRDGEPDAAEPPSTSAPGDFGADDDDDDDDDDDVSQPLEGRGAIWALMARRRPPVLRAFSFDGLTSIHHPGGVGHCSAGQRLGSQKF